MQAQKAIFHITNFPFFLKQFIGQKIKYNNYL